MSNGYDEEDEDAVLQEREVMASPDVEPARDPTEALEGEVEVEEEDRESDRIEEREDEITSDHTKSVRHPRSRKGTRQESVSVRKRTK